MASLNASERPLKAQDLRSRYSAMEAAEHSLKPQDQRDSDRPALFESDSSTPVHQTKKTKLRSTGISRAAGFESEDYFTPIDVAAPAGRSSKGSGQDSKSISRIRCANF
eukprot:COSAG05_NODE_109_length_18675_cov_6.774279_18_plen_109_part_00